MVIDVSPSPWWKDAVVYQIYPRSFADGSGDGIGDLDGMRSRLEYLDWLGIDALWLSPIFPSPMCDFGYDVADYCDVDPVFGDLDSFDALVAEAHGRGIRVLLDWVPNHTSSRHPWFASSRSATDDPRRDWYLWRDPAPDGGPPNNWASAFTGEPAWAFDEPTGQYYLHLFLPEQPDLNWRNPEVVAAMHATLRFWLDRGVDGFRIDVAHALAKRADFADVADPRGALGGDERFDPPFTHAILRGVREVLDAYDGDRVAVGEVYLLDTAKVATYYGAGDELHLAFNFPPLLEPWQAPPWRAAIDEVRAELGLIGAWPTWVLSNHDSPRHRTRFGTEARARGAAVMLLTLRGTPFLYQGEELGLQDAVVPPARVVDPGGRDGCRAPLPWTPSAPHGWDGAGPWLPFPPDAAACSVEAQRGDARSMLHLYRRLLRARHSSPALRGGDLRLLGPLQDTVAYDREADGDRRRVIVNFAAEERPVPAELADGWVIEVASDGIAEGATLPYGAGAYHLAPDRAVVLRPNA